MGSRRAGSPYLRLPWLALILLLAPLLVMARPQPAAAAGVVSQCTETALRAALAGGGLVTFNCSGTIPVASPIELTADTTIDGGGAVTIDGQGTTYLFVVNSGVTVEMTGLTMTGGFAPGFGVGGAIGNFGDLTITSSTFSGNNSVFGAGGAIANFGDLTITASTFSGNSANTNAGGAIYSDGTLAMTGSTLVDNHAGTGGGAIYNDGPLTIMESTLAGNSAGWGGAIHNILGTVMIAASTLEGNQALFSGGAIYNGGTLLVTASTLAGNSAGTGGAIYTFGTAQVWFSTLAGNNASGLAGAIAKSNGTVVIFANIFSSNSPASCAGGMASIGYNVSNDGSCDLTVPGDLQNSDPQLGPLAYNGGPTQTMLPAPTSPAIGRVPNRECAVNSVANNHSDQRGAPRPEGSAPCDSGSVELQINSFFCVGERSGSLRYVSVPNGCVRGEYRLLPVASGIYDFCVGDRSGTMRYLPNSGTNCLRGEWKLTLPQVEPTTICVGERSRTVRYVVDAAACNVRGELPYFIINPAG